MADPFSALIGAGAGGVLGGVSGLFSSISQRSQAADLRKAIRQGVGVGEATTTRQVGTIISTPEYLAATKFVRSFYGMEGDPRADLYDSLQGTFGPNLYGQQVKGYGGRSDVAFNRNGSIDDTSRAAWNEQFLARRFGANTGDAALLDAANNNPNAFGAAAAGLRREAASGSLIRRGTDPTMNLGADARDAAYRAEAGAGADAYDELASGFDRDAPLSALERDFVKGLGQAQSARGLYSSQAGAAAEASGLAALKTQKQMEMLPMLLQLAEAPVGYAHKYMGANLNQSVYSRTGGKAVYGQVSEGSFGGVAPGAAAFGGAVSGAMAGAGLGISAGQYLSGGGKKAVTPKAADTSYGNQYYDPSLQPMVDANNAWKSGLYR